MGRHADFYGFIFIGVYFWRTVQVYQKQVGEGIKNTVNFNH